MAKNNEELKEIIEIPEGTELSVVEKEVSVIKDGNELKRKFNTGNLKIRIKKQDNYVIIESNKSTKREKKLLKTISAHIKNMVKGLEEKFTYKIQICFVHFPMTVTVDKENNEIVIKNFLGGKYPKKAKILPEVEVKVDKDFITVESFNKESAGQTAANIERATKVKSKDRRVFQDGCFIVSKPVKEK